MDDGRKEVGRPREGKRAQRLRTIAELIGCPVEVLERGNRDSHPVLLTNEMLGLWTRIENDADRRLVLALMRRLVADL